LEGLAHELGDVVLGAHLVAKEAGDRVEVAVDQPITRVAVASLPGLQQRGVLSL